MKRTVDILLALTLLIVLLPLIFTVMISIWMIDGRPIFFIQSRPGFNEEPFRIIKFRTMSIDKNLDISNDINRITKFGNFLRKTSIDELPEIFNILKGDMSFVGPRPLLMEYLNLYSEEEKLRHSVKPGITGWAQINGRNNIDWKQKLELDIWYVKNRNIILDLKIIFITIFMVIRGRGVAKSGFATTDKFRGHDKK
tara:strand:+ start:280 stop:870 length:591 start_codon:yes stop_codon:yes gene_type:complete